MHRICGYAICYETGSFEFTCHPKIYAAVPNSHLRRWYRGYYAVGTHTVPFTEVTNERTSFPLRTEVEGCNNGRLNALGGSPHVYHSVDSRGYNAKGELVERDTAKRLLERLIASSEIALKVKGIKYRPGY